MKTTRAIALCALTIAIALAIGAIVPPASESALAQHNELIIFATNLPTPALPTEAPAPALPTEAPAPTPALPTEAPAPTPALPTEAPTPAVEAQAPAVEAQAPAVEAQAPAVEAQAPALAPLETLYCPCNVLEADQPAPVITDRQREYSARRTR